MSKAGANKYRLIELVVSTPVASYGQTKWRFYILSTSIALSLLHLLYTWPGNFGLESFPNVYALCSPPGTLKIYTVDQNNSKAECLVVKSSYFVDTGSLAGISARNGGAKLKIKFIDSESIIIPGLTDSHVHSLEYGLRRQLPLDDANSIKETVAKVRRYIEDNPEIYKDTSVLIEGWGWDHTKWPIQRWPTSADLETDPITRGRLIALKSKDLHATWVSQRVLDSMYPIPEVIGGGIIVRDSNGNPSGVFMDNARDLIPIPVPTEEVLFRRWMSTVADAHAVGLTSIHDAMLDPHKIEFFHNQAKRNKLALRVYGMRLYEDKDSYWGNTSEKILGAGNDRFTVRSVKIVGDGALRSGGAALYEPYTDNPDSRGFMRTDPKVMNDVIPKFVSDGWQVNVHAIGDRANGAVLDAFEIALTEADTHTIRPRLEHAQVLKELDITRIGKLGVIASIQPTHAISDMWFGEERLGPQRVKGLYAFRSVIDSGARVTLGSDSPVEDMNPLSGFYAAVTRVSFDGRSPHGPGGWFPTQRMTRLEALRGITIDPAHASFTENILGSIVPGKRADYVVLSKDIMEVPIADVLETRVLVTAMDGVVVYSEQRALIPQDDKLFRRNFAY